MKKILMLIVLIIGFNYKTYNASYANNQEYLHFRKIKNDSFKIGEKLTYRMHYGIIDAGEAVLEVQESKIRAKGRKLFKVVGIGRSIRAFDWFFKVRDRYESYIDTESIIPWFFIRRVNEGGFKIKQDYTLHQDLKYVDDGETKIKTPENIQDMLSAYYYARTLDFQSAEIGDTFEFNTIVDEEIFPLKIKFLGREEIKIRSGKYKALKFCPIIQTGRVFKKEEDLTVWISDDKNKIPLYGKAKILFGSIKLEVVKYEGLLNPIAKL